MSRRLLRLVRTIACADCAEHGGMNCSDTCALLVAAIENYKSAFLHMIFWHKTQLKTCQLHSKGAHRHAIQHLSILIEEPVHVIISRKTRALHRASKQQELP